MQVIGFTMVVFLLWTPQTTHRPAILMLLECQVLDNVTVQALHVFTCW